MDLDDLGFEIRDPSMDLDRLNIVIPTTASSSDLGGGGQKLGRTSGVAPIRITSPAVRMLSYVNWGVCILSLFSTPFYIAFFEVLEIERYFADQFIVADVVCEAVAFLVSVLLPLFMSRVDVARGIEVYGFLGCGGRSWSGSSVLAARESCFVRAMLRGLFCISFGVLNSVT